MEYSLKVWRVEMLSAWGDECARWKADCLREIEVLRTQQRMMPRRFRMRVESTITKLTSCWLSWGDLERLYKEEKIIAEERWSAQEGFDDPFARKRHALSAKTLALL